MKNSIGFQLFTRGLLILLFILLLAIAGQICISLLKKTSSNIIVEYSELDALQEYRTELNHVIIHFDNFVLEDNKTTRNNFKQNLKNCYKYLEKCEEILTHRHDKTVLNDLGSGLQKLDSLKNILFSSTINLDQKKSLQAEVIQIIVEGTSVSEELLLETKIEIDEFIERNDTAVFHSTITIISLGFVLILIVTIGGILFIKKLTTPIFKLLASTKKLKEGKFETSVDIKANNEFQLLGESFNSMIQSLEKTTISRNHYDSILKNMIEPLIVTDLEGNVKTVNHVVINLLGYTSEEIIESKVNNLFYAQESSNASDSFLTDIKQGSITNLERTMLAKDGKKIPVLVSTSFMNEGGGNGSRYIIVAHDLRERIESEKKLEDERKERLIAINDAQEEEKFRIAIDLHDGLGQILTATSYSFHNYFGEFNSNNPEYQQNVDSIQSQIDYAIRESKNIAHNLIPIALKDFGLLAAINNLIDQANSRSEIKFKFEAFNFTKRIDKKLEKAVFRIFQEAINNILKHSKAKNANFQINKYEDALVITIEDDGIGFDLNQKSDSKILNGIGLIGMRERVAAFNGNFSINTEPNTGTDILIEIPCRMKDYEEN